MNSEQLIIPMTYDQTPRIENLPDTRLVGQRLRMSFAANRVPQLWQSFMPRQGEIPNRAGTDLFSLEIHDDLSFFQQFDPTREFDKWAAVEVTDLSSVPTGMETLTVPAGAYAVFTYRGAAAQAAPFYQYIFTGWLPQSGYRLEHRPHFARMGEKYKNNSPDSEEEIWVPVTKIS